MPPANSKVLISFDLDFTLINNKEGIVNSFNHALNKHGVQEIAAEEIEKMIGIPLHEMFEKVSDLNPSQLSASFREYYGRKGIYQVILIPGVKKMLQRLKNKNFTLDRNF